MTLKESLDKYVKLCELNEIDSFSIDDREWKELKKHIIENVEEYELISNVAMNSIVERHNEIFRYKGLHSLGHKLELLHNRNMGEYISSYDSVGVVYEGENT